MTELNPIGHVRTPHAAPADTPIQARLNPDASATIEILPDYAAGLDGLDGFDFAWMLTLLHLDRDVDGDAAAKTPAADPADPLRPVPFLAADPGLQVGVFATRYPVRPNPIGLSLIRIDRIDGATVHFSGVDVADGTPVVDLKPWVPQFDLPDHRSAEDVTHVRIGWYRDSKLDLP